MGDQPLADVRVLEVGTGIVSGFAGRLLAGFGADVVHVARAGFPALSDDDATYLDAGKQHIEANDGELVALGRAADLIIEEADNGLAALRSERPELSVITTTPFGLTGPYSGYRTTDAVSFALGGIMWLTGDPDRPLVSGGSQAFYLAGLSTFSAALAAHTRARRTGRGDHVELSAQELATAILELFGPMASYQGLVQPRTGNQLRAAWAIYPCLDGYAGAFCLERQIHALFDLIGDPELNDERFRDPLQRPDNNDELTAYVLPFFAGRTKAELLALGRKHRIPIGVAMTPADLLVSDGLVARDVFDQLPTSSGTATIPGRPFPGLGWKALSPPAIGSAAELLRSDWSSPTVLSEATRPNDVDDRADRRPLDGIRIVDLTMMWAGPFATQKLAELGADVIKVESPNAWDNIRTLLPQDPAIAEPWNTAFYFESYGKSKRSLTLDLATEAGRDLLLRLVADADVVIENYRADVLDKLGLGYDTLRSARDDIVLISMAAFGKAGPEADLVGFGPVIEMMSGLASLTGWGDGEPYKTGISYGDPVGGTAAVAAVLLALSERDRTGTGRWIDLGQRELGSCLAGGAFVAASLRDEAPRHWGNRHPDHAPQGAYRCHHDEWVVLSVIDDEAWRELCRLMARHDLADLSAAERRERHDELDDAIGEWSGQRSAQTVMELCQQRGVPAGRVLDGATILTDPHLGERGFWTEVEHPLMRSWRQPGASWRFAEADVGHRHHAPLFGQHNTEILQGLLGLTDDEIEALAAESIIASAPINPGVG